MRISQLLAGNHGKAAWNGLVFAALFLASTVTGSASAAAVSVDDFSAPSPASVYVINFLNSDPSTIVTADPSILGGGRSVTIDVVGAASLVSAAGSIGDGNFSSNTGTPGSIITLLYNGAAGLGMGAADLVDSGNNKLVLDFVALEAGIGTAMGIDVTIVSGAGSAGFVGSITESASPFTYEIPYSSFLASGGFGGFGAVDSITIVLNPAGASNVDFTLDGIRSVPEPSTLALAALGLSGVVCLAGRRRKN